MYRPALMGIVNVTPDSFSGDGRLGEAAIRHAEALVAAGADILDIGAESTRPGATLLTADEEWARLEPFLGVVCHTVWREKIRLSVDTRHAQTAARALELGVEIINDVGGLRDHAMAELLSGHECDIVVMHALTLPADKAVTWAADANPIEEILYWKHAILERAAQMDIAPERLIFDPGIGFGNTPPQALALISGAAKLVNSGGRWLFGHSRKSFLNPFLHANADDRDALTRAFSAVLAEAEVAYLRVHDVAGHQRMFQALCT